MISLISFNLYHFSDRVCIFINCLLHGLREAITTIHSFVPNRVLIWTSDHSNQLQEEWQFRNAPDCTVVMLTLSYDPMGKGLFKYLTGRNQLHNQVDKAVSEILERLKRVTETAK